MGDDMSKNESNREQNKTSGRRKRKGADGRKGTGKTKFQGKEVRGLKKQRARGNIKTRKRMKPGKKFKGRIHKRKGTRKRRMEEMVTEGEQGSKDLEVMSGKINQSMVIDISSPFMVFLKVR